MPPLYHLHRLTQTYNGRAVLDVPELEIDSGEMLALVGPSGAGKSTLLRLLHFLEAPTTGEIHFRGETTVPLDARREIAMVFQRPELLNRSVWENVTYGLRLRGMGDDARVAEALTDLDLLPLKDAPAHTLSGGEAQRVALARALVLRPRVLLLDEPTANLDPRNVALVEEVIHHLRVVSPTTVVFVTHNIFQARRLAGRVAFLLNGQLVEVSTADHFFDTPSDSRSVAFVRGEMVY